MCGGRGAFGTIVLNPVRPRRILPLFVCQVPGLFAFHGAGVASESGGSASVPLCLFF